MLLGTQTHQSILFVIIPSSSTHIVLRPSTCWIWKSKQLSVDEPTWLPSSNQETSQHGIGQLKDQPKESGEDAVILLDRPGQNHLSSSCREGGWSFRRFCRWRRRPRGRPSTGFAGRSAPACSSWSCSRPRSTRSPRNDHTRGYLLNEPIVESPIVDV